MTLSDQISELLGGAKSGTTFGFDYGTTNCVFAYKEGVTAPPKMLTLPQAIRNGAPSLFMRGDDGREYACDEVLQQNGLENNPGAVCASIKTKLREKVIRLNGHDYEPKYIAAAVAKRFMQICEHALEDEMVYDEIKVIVCGVNRAVQLPSYLHDRFSLRAEREPSVSVTHSWHPGYREHVY